MRQTVVWKPGYAVLLGEEKPTDPKLDAIMADWRRQERERRKKERSFLDKLLGRPGKRKWS